MTTISLADVGSGFKRTAINTNFDAIEAAINNDLLDKAGGKALEADLDYNSKKAINMADGINNTDGATVAQLNAAISGSASGLIASQIESQLGSDVSTLVTTFTGITYVVGANNLEVYRNGNRQTKTRDYTETSTSSITWVSAPNATDNLEFRTNTATTTSVTTTAAITHVEDSTTYNLGTYLQNRHAGSVKDYGAVGDGVTDDTVAIQAAIDAKHSRLLFPFGEYVVTGLNLADVTTVFIGESDVRTAATSSIVYSSSASSTGAVFTLSVMSAGNKNRFEQLDIDTNDRAQYGFYLASSNTFQAIKNMTFDRVYVTNLKSGAVGWQIGDATNTTYDTDAWNHNFYSCHARGSTGSIGWVVDATNAYEISWYSCSSGRKDGSNLMLTGIKTIRGSGFYVNNFFGDKLQATGSPWLIDHKAGQMVINAMTTEDRRVLKARSNGENDASISMTGVSVNDETGDGDTSIDTTIRTVLTNCTLGSATYNRKLTATNRLNTTNVFLGSSGEYDLSGVALDNSTLEGHLIGSDMGNIAINELCELWTTTSDPAAPQGWGVQKGTGTGTINRATTNVEQGRYVVDINCTVASSGIFGITENSYGEVDVTPWRGRAINFYAIFHRDATETPVMSVLLDGASTNVTGGVTILEEAASGGKVLVWGKVDVQASSSALTSIQLGIPAGSTGHVYLDSFGVLPYDFSSYTPALFELVQKIGYDRFVSNLRAGTLRLKDYTLWVDTTGDLRVLSGDRATDTDGTVVGTQS